MSCWEKTLFMYKIMKWLPITDYQNCHHPEGYVQKREHEAVLGSGEREREHGVREEEERAQIPSCDKEG